MRTGGVATSGSKWKCTAGLQFSDHSYWAFHSFLVLLLFCFWKNCYFGRQFPFFPRSFVWIRSWGQTSWALVCVYLLNSCFSWFFPWSHHSQIEKENMFTHTSPCSMCAFSCPFPFWKRIGNWKFQSVLFHLNRSKNIFYFLISAKFNETEFMKHSYFKLILIYFYKSFYKLWSFIPKHSFIQCYIISFRSCCLNVIFGLVCTCGFYEYLVKA